MPILIRRIFIILLILVILAVGYFIWGKNLISPPRASEALTLYNIDSRADVNNHLPTRTVRWETLPVAVYNESKIKNLQNIIDEWNQAMGRVVFILGDESSPVIIKADAEIQPDGFANFSFHNYLLENFQIRVHPDLTPLRAVKKMLGRALGFFGNTTDDSNSIMDIDPDDSNIIITPFVVSILNELYSLPPGTRGIVADKKIRDAIKKYNVDSLSEQYRYFTLQEVEAQKSASKLPDPLMPTKTVRWRNLPITVYDNSSLIPDLPAFINDWNQAMGQEVFKIGGPDSPITFEIKLAESQPYELFYVEAKKAFYLKRIRFFNDSEWITPGKIRHQLGHALGFFGHTTDDPDGIMDTDYDKQKVISPFVISVLKELYRLPPGVKIQDQFGRSDEEVLVLRQAIKEYNLDSRGEPELVIRTARWRNFPVSVYNQANISELQGILSDWNQAMGQEVFKIGGSDSPIVIEADSDPNPLPFPTYKAKTKNYLLTLFKIKVNLQNPNLHYLKHQLGHALGFFGHTKDDDPNGIMNADHRRTDTIISSFVVSVLKELYYLPPGVLINY